MPHRIFAGKTIVVASHNAGKVEELVGLLAPYGIEIRSAAELNLPEPEETGDTFIANAELKATAAVEASGMAALADDSGIAIHGLGGEPGIYSARWAGPAKDFSLAMARVNEELGANPDRTAAFFCALSLAWPDGHVESFIGAVEGAVVWPPRGDNGFGYDSMFLPSGGTRTFGEMSFAEKQPLTHRDPVALALILDRHIDGDRLTIFAQQRTGDGGNPLGGVANLEMKVRHTGSGLSRVADQLARAIQNTLSA